MGEWCYIAWQWIYLCTKGQCVHTSAAVGPSKPGQPLSWGAKVEHDMARRGLAPRLVGFNPRARDEVICVMLTPQHIRPRPIECTRWCTRTLCAVHPQPSCVRSCRECTDIKYKEETLKSVDVQTQSIGSGSQVRPPPSGAAGPPLYKISGAVRTFTQWRPTLRPSRRP